MLRFDFDLMHWNRFYFQLKLEATFSGCCVRGRGLWQLKFGFYFSIAFTLSSSLFLSLLLGKRCFLRLLLRQKGRGASPYGGCCWKSRSEGSWRATAFEEGESSQSGPVPPTDNTHTGLDQGWQKWQFGADAEDERQLAPDHRIVRNQQHCPSADKTKGQSGLFNFKKSKMQK